MRIIARRTLREFCTTHPDAKLALDAWWNATRRAQWASPSELTLHNRNARSLGEDRVVFKVKGNHYRLILKVHYARGIIYIRFIGTHAEYDRIDAHTI